MTDSDDYGIRVGAAFLGSEAARQMMSPERWQREQDAMRREQEEAEAEAAQLRAEQEGERQFWAHHRGLEYRTPGQAVADVLRGFSDAADRADRRQLREQAKLEARILNGEVFVPVE